MLAAYQGAYAFPVAGELAVAFEDGGLVARYEGPSRLYFRGGTAHRLLSAEGEDLFLVEHGARDVLRFERSETGRVRGLTINPGPWALRARHHDGRGRVAAPVLRAPRG